ncbi:MAG: hypothetical protein V4501_05715 [Pseudomonadota bacterium]
MPESKPKKPLLDTTPNPLKISLKELVKRGKQYSDEMSVKYAAKAKELIQQLKKTNDPRALTALIIKINKSKMMPDIKFFNLLLDKLGKMDEWTISKALFNFLVQYKPNKESYSIMFEIAAEHRPLNFVSQVYMRACAENFDDITMHSRMLNLLQDTESIGLAKVVFRYAFATQGSTRNNFSSATLMHNAHAKMLTIAIESDEIDFAWLVYQHALVNTKPTASLHKQMIDYLLQKELFLEAITLYQNYNFDLQTENKRDTTEVYLSGQSYGTAYLGLLRLLSDVKAPVTVKIIPEKLLADKNSAAPDIAKQLLKYIEKNFNAKKSELKVDYSDPKHYGFYFKPYKLSAEARPFFPSKDNIKPREESKENFPKVISKKSR